MCRRSRCSIPLFIIRFQNRLIFMRFPIIFIAGIAFGDMGFMELRIDTLRSAIAHCAG